MAYSEHFHSIFVVVVASRYISDAKSDEENVEIIIPLSTLKKVNMSQILHIIYCSTNRRSALNVGTPFLEMHPFRCALSSGRWPFLDSQLTVCRQNIS